MFRHLFHLIPTRTWHTNYPAYKNSDIIFHLPSHPKLCCFPSVFHLLQMSLIIDSSEAILQKIYSITWNRNWSGFNRLKWLGKYHLIIKYLHFYHHLRTHFDHFFILATLIIFQKHKRRFYTWTSPDCQHQNKIDYIICSQRWRSSMQSAKTRLGAECGSDHELLFAKFRPIAESRENH